MPLVGCAVKNHSDITIQTQLAAKSAMGWFTDEAARHGENGAALRPKRKVFHLVVSRLCRPHPPIYFTTCLTGWLSSLRFSSSSHYHTTAAAVLAPRPSAAGTRCPFRSFNQPKVALLRQPRCLLCCPGCCSGSCCVFHQYCRLRLLLPARRRRLRLTGLPALPPPPSCAVARPRLFHH